MNKKYLHLLTIFSLLSLIFYSCVLDPDSKIREENYLKFSVEDAKTFFEEKVDDFQIVPFTKSPGSTRSEEVDILSKIQKEPVAPLWANAKSFNKDGMAMIEVPLNLPAYRNIKSAEVEMSLGANSPVSNYLRSLVNATSRLLATYDEVDGVELMMVTIISDKLQNKRTRAGDINLSLSDLKDFSGRIIYRKMDGSFLKGDIYNNGQLVGITYPTGEDLTNEIDRQVAQTRGLVYYLNCLTTTYTTTVCEYQYVVTAESIEVYGPFCHTVVEEWKVCWITEEWVGDPAYPSTEPVFSLNTTLGSSSDVLGEETIVTVSATGSNYSIIKIKLLMEYDLYEGTSTQIRVRNTMPGSCRYNAEITYMQDGKTRTICAETTRTIQFPTRDKILRHVQADFDRIWEATKSYATANRSAHLVQERGAWVWLDAKTGTYSVDENDGVFLKTPVPLLTGNETCTVDMQQPSDDIYEYKYVVANFHTHFPICYAATDCYRTGGPTPGTDEATANSFKMPAFVYDYDGQIDNSHQINKKAKVYTCGVYTKREK